MNDSENFLAEFVSGLVNYRDFQNAVLSDSISKKLLKEIPLIIVDDLISGIRPTVQEQLDVRDSFREWGIKNKILVNQFEKTKLFVFDCVKSKIQMAFDNVMLGEGVSLAQAHAMDNHRSNKEQMLERENDKDISWQFYPVKNLEKFTALNYLDSKGFAYYLPAYLIWCMDNCLEDPFNNIASELFGTFDPNFSCFKIKLAALRPLQKRGLIDFFWLFAIYSDVYREDCISSLTGIDDIDFLLRKLVK